jgi:hypothetical protein
MTNKIQLCRIVYCSLTALHVSSDIFVYHQEHLNCIYSFWFYSRVSLSDASDDERKYRSKYVEQSRNNKLSYTAASPASADRHVIHIFPKSLYTNHLPVPTATLHIFFQNYYTPITCQCRLLRYVSFQNHYTTITCQYRPPRYIYFFKITLHLSPANADQVIYLSKITIHQSPASADYHVIYIFPKSL